MHPKGRRDSERDPWVRNRGLANHPRDVTGRVSSRGEHIWKGDDLIRAGRHTARKPFCNRGFRQFHVRVPHHYVVTDHPLDQVGHTSQYMVGLVEAGTVINEQDSLHVARGLWFVAWEQIWGPDSRDAPRAEICPLATSHQPPATTTNTYP